MAFTVPQIIEIAKYSQVFANSAASKGGIFKPVVDPLLGIKIYVIRKDVEDVYNYNPNWPGLVQTANYLYGLCGRYALAAWAVISNGGGGGSITPIPPTGTLQYLEFVVSDSSAIPTGGSQYTFDTIPYDYRGFELIFNRGNIPQGRLDNGNTYFTWNSLSGAFQCFPAATVDEDFQFYITI